MKPRPPNPLADIFRRVRAQWRPTPLEKATALSPASTRQRQGWRPRARVRPCLACGRPRISSSPADRFHKACRPDLGENEGERAGSCDERAGRRAPVDLSALRGAAPMLRAGPRTGRHGARRRRRGGKGEGGAGPGRAPGAASGASGAGSGS
jgi:hypothetical protein